MNCKNEIILQLPLQLTKNLFIDWIDLVDISHIDHAYLITPNYGLKVYNDINYTGDVILDVYNYTSSPVIVSPSIILSGKSCILYFG